MTHWRLMMCRLDHASPLAQGLVSAVCVACGWLVVVFSVLELWP